MGFAGIAVSGWVRFWTGWRWGRALGVVDEEDVMAREWEGEVLGTSSAIF